MKTACPSPILRESILIMAGALGAAAASAATITVTGTGDAIAVDGVVTLREAITSINNGANVNADVVAVGTYGVNDTIHFDIPGTGVHVIAPLSSLPNITKAMTIDGYSQPGSIPNANGPGLPDNATLLIELNGVHESSCLAVGPTTGGGTTIRGLVINRCVGDGILLSSSTGGNTVQGNFIGTDPTGTISLGVGGSGVNIFAQTVVPESNDVIGGTSPADRNIVSGAFTGVSAGTGSGHLVQGNFIGTDATGTHALPNGSGIFIESASDTIGGTTPAARNVISGNSSSGVSIGSFVEDAIATLNVVEGNFIGTDVSGTSALGNMGNGVDINGVINTIGGTTPGSGNLISGNAGDGIIVATGNGSFVRGNFIGTDVTGTASLGNEGGGVQISASNVTVGGTIAGSGNVIAFNGANNVVGGGVIVVGGVGNAIRRNSIFANTSLPGGHGLGIDLGANGVTVNDLCDADTGPNNLQNFPILTTAFSGGGSTTIQGTLNSTASTTYQIDLFSNVSCDPSGHGEGETFLGSTMVTTDGSCNGSFNVTLPVTVSPQTRLTATATDPAGNTSEFSACISLQAEYHTIPPCRVADTRGPTGPYGGPALNAGGNRTFVIGAQCVIPATAQAVSFNFTITQPTAPGDLRTFPGGGTLPVVSTMNWSANQTRANNAIVPLGASGDIVTHVDQGSGTVEFIIDVNGYFQ